jgi:hypothetical protein
MKKIHALATLLLMGIASYAQNESLNLKKYWQYREKFKKHFVFYDETKATFDNRSYGGGIPFNHINYVWNYNGEEPTCERNYTWDVPSDPNTSMGSRKIADALANYDTYLGFLATEYRLLKNENADVSSILSEIYYALYAADRMDKRSDAYLQQNYSLPDNADGYFIRDDGEYELADKFFAEYEYSNDGRDVFTHKYECKVTKLRDVILTLFNL